MILSVEELKKLISTNESDEVLEVKLQALELIVREYTNNRFHQRPSVKIRADVVGGVFACDSVPFKVGDTVQVTVGDRADDCGLYTIKKITGDTFTVNEEIVDMWSVNVIKVKYPTDVKVGVAEIMDWKLKHKGKAGLSSETISRHSVTYDRATINDKFGVPNDLVEFLREHKKARF